jgi:hypothetical protein
MKKFLKDLVRPSILPIVSAAVIVLLISITIIPLMRHFQVFYQGQSLARPAHIINFETKEDQPTIFILGGSRFREMAFSDEHVNKVFKKKADINFNYINTATPGTGLAEQIMFVAQTHFKKGSIMFLGVNASLTSMPQRLMAQRIFKHQRLNFLDYSSALTIFKKHGLDVDKLTMPKIYQARIWLGRFSAEFNWKSLVTQGWNEWRVPYVRPYLFGRNNNPDIMNATIKKITKIFSEFDDNHIFNRELMQELIELGQKKGYRVYLFETPSSPIAQKVEAPVMARYNEDLHYLEQKTGAQIIYADNSLLLDQDFHDFTHQNEFGRAKYEATFMTQLAAAIADSASQDGLK